MLLISKVEACNQAEILSSFGIQVMPGQQLQLIFKNTNNIDIKIEKENTNSEKQIQEIMSIEETVESTPLSRSAMFPAHR